MSSLPTTFDKQHMLSIISSYPEMHAMYGEFPPLYTHYINPVYSHLTEGIEKLNRCLRETIRREQQEEVIEATTNLVNDILSRVGVTIHHPHDCGG